MPSYTLRQCREKEDGKYHLLSYFLFFLVLPFPVFLLLSFFVSLPSRAAKCCPNFVQNFVFKRLSLFLSLYVHKMKELACKRSVAYGIGIKRRLFKGDGLFYGPGWGTSSKSRPLSPMKRRWI